MFFFSSGSVGYCSKNGALHSFECLSCNAKHFEETGGFLAIRVEEHLASKRRELRTSALSKQGFTRMMGATMSFSAHYWSLR